MTDKTTLTGCGRGEDLVSFLYGEADEREARDFKTHLQNCGSCRTEFAAFGQLHQSMLTWRDEMFAGFVSSSVPAPVRRKSALVALREFFDLSPLWMKGAVGFAVLALCTLALLNVSRVRVPETPAPQIASDAKYTEKQVQERIDQARTEWLAAQASTDAQHQADDAAAPTADDAVTPTKARNNVVKYSTRQPKGRRPLSRSEREQLAADLRLRSTDDYDLTLLGDRINQEF